MKTQFLPFVILICASSGLSQPPPPGAAGPSTGTIKKFAGWPSIATISSSDQFVSLEGRFRIRLPKDIQGFGSLSPKQTGTSATGQQYTWKFAEGEVVFFFLDFPDSTLTGSPADLAQITTNSKTMLAQKFPDAKLVSENQSTLNQVPSSFFVYDLGTKGVLAVQLYIDKKRVYRFNAVFKDMKTETFLVSAFKSFKLIAQSDVDAELRKMYEAIKPGPLPQIPVVARLTSDAQDDGLKGKVKKVVEESEDRSGTWGVQGRKISSIDYYDQNGSLTQRDSYDSQGNPFQITVYGYINGKRVSNSKTARYEYDPPPAAAPPRSATVDAKAKNDSRYVYSFEYKYESGKLVEHQLVYNNGRKGMRYVYKHSQNQVEELVYTDEGKLNQRYVSILDANGHEIEKTHFGLVNFDIYGDQRYKNTYELDSAGNWIKKITEKEVKENGVTSWQPAHVSYRTVTYY